MWPMATSPPSLNSEQSLPPTPLSGSLKEMAVAYLGDVLILAFFGLLAYLWLRRAAKRDEA